MRACQKEVRLRSSRRQREIRVFLWPLQQGECLSSIAKLYGFANWNTIYNSDLNTGFRGLRPTPRVLFPGDHFLIPDKQIKKESCQTAMLHTFKLLTQQTRRRLIARDIERRLLAGKEIPADALKGV
jgi:hypothetical protein